MLLTLTLILVTVRPMEVLYGSLPACMNGGDAHRSQGDRPRLKVIPEWQEPAVTADREAEKLHDARYGTARRFVPMGTATFLFVHISSYRLGPSSFGVVGLGATDVFRYSNPAFFCSWHPHVATLAAPVVHCNGTAIQPDPRHVSFGRQYTGTVVSCDFASPVGVDGAGGHLVVTATHGSDDLSALDDVMFVAKTESPGQYNASLFRAPYEFDHVYCGNGMYGDWVNPRRVREWLAYHVRYFGPRSHFFLYDAGALDDDVRKVLQPWVDLGRVTITNVRQESRFSTHIHSQFAILSDCLLRSRTLSTWTWFFDLDEYIVNPPGFDLQQTLEQVQKDFWGSNLKRVSLKQIPMDFKHCQRTADPTKQESEWAIEKLVYRRTEAIELEGHMDRKSFVRSDSALAMGPHEPPEGGMILAEGEDVGSVTIWTDKFSYYHYHGTTTRKDLELCQELVDPGVNVTTFSDIEHQFETFQNVSHQLDLSMKAFAEEVKEFETSMIGS
ncbi:galactan beta-1,4-galactosyltransferase [Marchantia polymorpha subsp. ruderalis]|uniref:Glycosyltransferase family 92 protein n=2 Tax=Marchantia polymorpha TaxID=3197 RepID=A0AAF6B844_MARPO|nr:hypothetical protein MARPO_0112s0054 [Marchantia polymorpha]BBN08178.1 hypothetical protein Mp_4g09490 [Marchantia polymorpha subsp. ruderalis]|eukprot:PTQ31412.1 hypothetical protein MARPO_0112s0054 [Marchantia polymorpha]